MIIPSSIAITILTVLIFILYSKTKKIKADKFLMAFLLTIALGVLNDVLWELFQEQNHLFRFGSVSVPLAAAFLYLYATSLTSIRKPSTLRKIIVFTPSILVLATNYFVAEIELVNRGSTIQISAYYFVKIALAATIVALASYELYGYSKRIKRCFSDIEKIDFRWLKFLVNSSLILVCCIPIGFVILKIWSLDSIETFSLVANSFVFAFVLILAFYGIKNTNAFKDVITEEKINDVINDEDGNTNTNIKSFDINEEQVETLTNFVEKEKPFLEERITISQLSQQVDIPQRQLSAIINSRFKMNFFDYINSYRINEFNQRVSNGDTKNFTILAIAFDCGFSSKSAFNRAYKKHVGVPPSEFVQSGTTA